MSDPTEENTEQNPFTKPGFIVSAALVIALIAAVIVIFALPRSESSPKAGQTTSTSSSPTPDSSQPANTGGSVCGLPASAETTLGSAPKSTWTLVGKMAAPADPETFGPGITDSDGVRSCFAHSPTGALYSAVNVIALGSSSEQDELKLADRLLVPGPGRDAAMKEAQTRTSSSTGTGESSQVRGFIIKAYNSTEAEIDLAVEMPNGALLHSMLSLRWVDGDWKIKATDDGEIFHSMAQIPDLNGYIPWSGV